MAQQKVKLNIPKDFTPSERVEFSDEIIDFIVRRTQAGRDSSNRKFSKYSKEYAKKKGVSRGAVDLTLTSDMLSSIKLLNHRSGSITVGFDAGTFANDKAEGNQKKNGRQFLGMNSADLDNLVDIFEG